MIAPTIRGNLALQDAGFSPLGIVVGAATYQVLRPRGCRFNRAIWRAGTILEYTDYVEGVTRTWADAIARLETEAFELGAHGVAGITVKEDWITNAASTLQIQLIGSAITAPGVRRLKRPFLSTLSTDQTLRLLLRGWIPCGIGVGVAAVHVHSYAASGFYQARVTQNVEMLGPTEGMRHARAQAETRLRLSPTLIGARGVIGANLSLAYQSDACSGGNTGVCIIGQMTATGVVRFGTPTVAIDTGLTLSKGAE